MAFAPVAETVPRVTSACTPLARPWLRLHRCPSMPRAHGTWKPQTGGPLAATIRRMSSAVPDLGHHRRRLGGRDPREPHRSATPLELLYDLVFVVAFGQAADQL